MNIRLVLPAVAALALAAAACTVATTTPATTGTHTTSTPASMTPPTRPVMAPAAARPAAPLAITRISTCPGRNAEVEEATAPPDYLYADWIGCGGIGFAASPDGGRHWSKAMTVPLSAGPTTNSWDPAIAVAHDGTIYVSYMESTGFGASARAYPLVAVSADHGRTFTHVYQVKTRQAGNWGDRDFIAVGPTGTLYLTWDYGPHSDQIKLICNKIGSCAFSHGDLNIVMQVSRDQGRTWGPITPVQPGFPAAGGDSAPLLVNPKTHLIDVLYEGHQTDPGSLALHPGYEFFTSSPDGVSWPASPQPVQPGAGPTALPDWWIDGALSADAAGNLYATWDTQTAGRDTAWLSYSTSQGSTWSAPVQVSPDTTNSPHIVQSATGRPGTVYVGWLTTTAQTRGYALFIRTYVIGKGWRGPARQVSARSGDTGIWPGDTFGIATLPGGTGVALTWGSAVRPAKASEIYATTVTKP
jgi:hypothetical protein